MVQSMSKIDPQIIMEALRSALPPVFSRSSLTKLTGGLINQRTIANLQSKNQGPPSFQYGKKIAFERDSFISWAFEKIITKPIEDKNE